jgi:hypothetical protein
MSFVPPFFGNFGKKVKDLFDKQYKYDNQLVSKNKTRSGLVSSLAVFEKKVFLNNAPITRGVRVLIFVIVLRPWSLGGSC